MKELPMELKQRVDEAGKDKEWLQKVRNAESMEKYVKLLGDKGIELPAEVKDAFTNSIKNKKGILEDNDLEKVTGGWTNIFKCPNSYNRFLCELTFCPHINSKLNTPDRYHHEQYCDQGYWSNICIG